MGLFNKKEKNQSEVPSLPELPDFPELPSLPYTKETKKQERIPQLPSYPNNSFGKKFSQNAIKDVVSGEKGEEVFDADEFGEDESQMMHEPQKKPYAREISNSPVYEEDKTEEIPREFRKAARIVKKTEPVFVRLDKFEESIQILEKTKEKILEIEKLLRDISKLKEQEESELELWQAEINTIKQQIDKIDKDVFSKIE